MYIICMYVYNICIYVYNMHIICTYYMYTYIYVYNICILYIYARVQPQKGQVISMEVAQEGETEVSGPHRDPFSSILLLGSWACMHMRPA